MIRAAFLFLLLACAVRADTVVTFYQSAHTQTPELWLTSGTSMEPLIYAGDRVMIWPDPFPPKADQLVLFRFFSKRVLHRVIIGKYGQLTTGGDHEFRRDGVPLTAETYLGTAHDLISLHYGGTIAFNADHTIPDRPWNLIPFAPAAVSSIGRAPATDRLIPRPATAGSSPRHLFVPPSRPPS